MGQEKHATHGKKRRARLAERTSIIAASAELTGLRRVSLASAILSFALVVWGAVVRVNGAGMTCPHWPACEGVFFPGIDTKVVFEVWHRYGAAVLTIVVVATVFFAWRARKELPTAFKASWFALGLIAAQIVLGAATVALGNNPPSVALHLVVGFLTFITLLIVAVIARGGPAPARKSQTRDFARLALVCTIVAFIAVFAAGYMSAANDGIACVGFPLCNGFAGALTPDQQIHMAHRFAAYATIAAVLIAAGVAMRTQQARKDITTISWLAVGLVILQGALGAFTVITRLDPILRVLHEANGALLTGTLAVLTYVSYHGQRVSL
jgi:heme A synthase